MSEKLVLNPPLMYIYKLTFKSGKSYVGCHIQKKIIDDYITSSSYYKKHPEDIIQNREILIYCKDVETLNFMETYCILSDKAYNGKNNVNWNLGNFVCCFKHCGHHLTEEQKLKLKGRKLSEEHKAKLRKLRLGVSHTVSEESKERMRQSWKLRKDYKGGKSIKPKIERLPDESRHRKPQSEETKRKIALAHKGKHHSKETKLKISKSVKASKSEK